MAIINRSKPVLVTGATGYVASWLVKRLLEEGLTVHATVRNPNNAEKLAHLNEIAKNTNGQLHFYQADLLKENSFKEAMQGCELVYHTASPFITDVKDPQRDLIAPAEQGTANVLNTAKQTESVKRVVVTSSCAAIYSDATECKTKPNGMLTENDWNTTASIKYQPYSYSKTLAERKAWELADTQNQWDLVTINPCLVFGPPLNLKATNSETFRILKQMGDGTMKMGVPKIGTGIVDVRDVATAHFQAGFTPTANGRYITCGHNTDFLEVAMTLQEKYGKNYPLPKKALPKWLLMIIGPMSNKLFTKKYIKNNVNIAWKADNSKIKNELGVTFRPLKETMEDSFQAMIESKAFGG